MKTTLTLITLALAGTLATQAQDAPQREGRGPRQVPPGLLKEFDKDGDGKLNDEESKAARESMQAKREEARKKMLAEFDKDKDGKLDQEERKTMREAMEAKRKALVEKYDGNKNGKLDPEEVKAARDAGEEMPMMRPGGRGQGGPRGEGRPNRGEGRGQPKAPAGE